MGQKAKTVKIFNFWFPESVEAKMYGRLMQRRDLYELAVGEFPNIFAQAIRSNARVQAQALSSFDLDAINELEEARKAVQSRALAKVWGNQNSSKSISAQLAHNWQQLVSTFEISDSEYSIPIPATFGNVSVGKFSIPIKTLSGPTAELLAAKFGSINLGFVLKKEDIYAIIKPESLVRLVEACLGNVEMNQQDLVGWFGSEQLLTALVNGDCGVFVGPEFTRTINKDLVQDEVDLLLSLEDVEFVPICQIQIS
jgi:hypothetical protein